MLMMDQMAIRGKLEELRQEHRDLDAAIASLTAEASLDMLRLQRLKKKKLSIKDMLAKLESSLIPDIIA